jgi:lysyl-tRNA synthetase class 2
MLDDIIKERQKKLEALKNAGIDPYPARTHRTASIADTLAQFDTLAQSGDVVSLAGRLMSIRDQGKIIFADLVDESGKVQAVLKDEVTENFDLWQAALDMGDFVSVAGPVFETKRGEKSVEVHEVQMLAKSMLPLPDKWAGLEDVEARLRERYVDLVANPDVKEMFRKKSIFWQSTREFLLATGFMEVETPILEPIAGGAEAEPFVTHHNALDTDFYLRIAPELNLKRLMVGGFEKVFEIGRIFRNEGIDAEHLQDYTQMEMYWAYQDYRGLMVFLENMIKYVIKKTFGTTVVVRKGQEVDWDQPWLVYDYYELFEQYTGLDLSVVTKDELLKKAKELGIDQADATLGRGRLIDLVYKRTVRPNLVLPGFLINPPIDIEPLAKRIAEDPNRVERFQIVAYGTELGKGFSELNDPADQEGRFADQAKLREEGDAEAQMNDDDYVNAMKYGMPPNAGFGMSERFFAVLVDKPIRETVFFPLMRPRQ